MSDPGGGPARFAPRLDLLLLAAILLAAFAARLPFRDVVLIRDEGEYALAGQRILQGALPYRDVYLQKTPLACYFMAIVQSIVPTNLAAIRIATAVYGLLATALVYLAAARLLSRAAGVWAALAFAVLCFDQAGILHSSSTEFLMLPWIVLSVLQWYEGRRRRSAWRLALAGAAAALAVQTKQTGIVVLVFLAADAVWTGVRRESGEEWPARPVRELAWALSGFLASSGAVLAYFAARGGLAAYLECVLFNNRQYVVARWDSPAWLLDLSRRVLVGIAEVDLTLWIAGTAGLALLAFGGRGKRASGLWILLVGFAAASLLTGKAYRHYYLPLVVPFALGCGYLFDAIARRAAAHRRLGVRLALWALLLVPWVMPLTRYYSLLTMTATEYERTLDAAAIPLAGVSQEVGRYLRSRTSEDDPVLVVGSQPQIYFWAERRPATRLVISYPMIAPYSYSAKLRREFLEDLDEVRPRYVVLAAVPTSLSEFPGAIEPFMASVYSRLDRDYDTEARFGRLIVFRRRGAL